MIKNGKNHMDDLRGEARRNREESRDFVPRVEQKDWLAQSPRFNQAVRLEPFGTQESRQQIDKQQQSHDARQHNHGSLSKNDGGYCGVSGK